ncbi:hypothetical protein THTE_1948 [Thermogutta terrifontis]|uniref:Uncharacterized protein n=1 Tax=Thermogutta terrifontis TaxID=1331910 RepID=A0A286RF12_9BACT|nr:hypothetical protein THTE_1948 [Thermogutta terrifontis]
MFNFTPGRGMNRGHGKAVAFRKTIVSVTNRGWSFVLN